MKRRTALLVTLVAIAIWPTAGCTDDDPGSEPVVGSFLASGTASAPDLVRLRAGAVSGDMVTVEVAIAGATTTNDLYSLAFDLVLSDASVARYVAASATMGPALTIGAGQGQALLVTQSGTRVVVGVSKTGGGPGTGNGIGATEEIVVSLVFRVLKAGATTLTLAGSPNNPQNPSANPAALDSTGALIGSVNFDAAAATITGM